MIKLYNILSEIFTINEFSKNDAIPEIQRLNKNLSVFIFGPPASGKSTFVKNFILRLNKNFAIVNPDDIDYILRGKDYTNTVRPKSVTALSIKRVKYLLKTGNNIIYDTTGNDFDRIKALSELAKNNNYTVIFIHVLDVLKDLHIKASQRERPVDPDYINYSYKKTQSLIKKYSNELKPDSYYIITTLNGKYKFFKYENNKLLRKKGDIYA